jgi:hypothetical protein
MQPVNDRPRRDGSGGFAQRPALDRNIRHLAVDERAPSDTASTIAASSKPIVVSVRNTSRTRRSKSVSAVISQTVLDKRQLGSATAGAPHNRPLRRL